VLVVPVVPSGLLGQLEQLSEALVADAVACALLVLDQGRFDTCPRVEAD
jgi:hypothetical protein